MQSVSRFMRVNSLGILFLILFSYFVFHTSATSSAQSVQDFVVNDFSASYKLDNTDPQGHMKIVEKIKLNFSGQNRGIYRAIPIKYGDLDTNPVILNVYRDNSPEPYISYEENGNLVLKIGSADKIITGEHEYKIEYEVENVIKFYKDHDELYWDVNGDQWQQNFLSVNAEVESGVSLKNSKVECFTGSFGSTSKSCEVSDEQLRFKAETTDLLTAL
jgi:uncharacterized membrane protein